MSIRRAPVHRPGAPIQIPPAKQLIVPYRAPAVDFDGKTVLQGTIRGSLTPSSVFSFSGWFNSVWYGKNSGGNTAAQYAWLIDPLGNFTPLFRGLFNQENPNAGRQWVSLGVSPPQGSCTLGNTVADLGDPNNFLPGTIKSLAGRGNVSCNVPAKGNPNFEDQYVGATDPDNNTEIDFNVTGIEITQQTNAAPATPGSWQHIMGTIDLGNGLAVMAFGDSQISVNFSPTSSITVNGLTIYIGGDNGSPSNNYIGGMSELYINPRISFIQNGAIPESTRRIFIGNNGAPVDPNANESISAPSGGANVNVLTAFPSIFLHGDRNTFIGNAQGSSGIFSVLTGGLTNSLTSPSDAFA